MSIVTNMVVALMIVTHYRCWNAARNAESNRRVRAMIDEQFRQERLLEGVK